MANQINTRILLKYDSLENWQKSAFNGTDATKYLKQGEIAIVTLAPNAETNPTATANQHPLLIKVGTGAHKFDDLPWASALAADVYAWAKKSENDFVTNFLALKTTDGTTMQAKLEAVFATDTELENAISGLSQQVNTWLTDYYTKSEVDALIEGVEKKIPGTDDFGVMSVTADKNKALAVDNSDPHNPKIEFKIDNTGTKGNVALTEDQNGLKANITVATGEAAGQVKIAGENVSVNGLAALAYKATITKNDFPTFETDVAAVKVTNATNADKATTAEMASTAQKVEQALTVKVGDTTIVYDGSAPETADIDAAIKNAIAAEGHPEYLIKKVETTTGYSATYQLTKDGTAVGAKIDIPKDMVVSKGEVITYENAGAWGSAGTYIVLTLANATNDTLYIPAAGLIEYVTSGSTADSQVIVVIDDKHEVTATIGAGKIGTTELADKAVTEDKLADAVKTKLNKDDNATYTLDGATSTSGATLKLVGAGAGAETTSILVKGDGIVKATYNSTDKAIELAHDKSLPGGHPCAVSGATINPAFGESQSFKVPYIDLDEYGHATYATDETITIELPALPEEKTYDLSVKGAGDVYAGFGSTVGLTLSHDNTPVYLQGKGASEENEKGDIDITYDSSDSSGSLVETITFDINRVRTSKLYDDTYDAKKKTTTLIFNCGSASDVI